MMPIRFSIPTPYRSDASNGYFYRRSFHLSDAGRPESSSLPESITPYSDIVPTSEAQRHALKAGGLLQIADPGHWTPGTRVRRSGVSAINIVERFIHCQALPMVIF